MSGARPVAVLRRGDPILKKRATAMAVDAYSIKKHISDIIPGSRPSIVSRRPGTNTALLFTNDRACEWWKISVINRLFLSI